MLTFAYQAHDPLGELIDGTIEAATRDEAITKLKREGLAVNDLREEAGGFDLMPSRIRAADIIFTTSQLAVMVDTGITMGLSSARLLRLHEARPSVPSGC